MTSPPRRWHRQVLRRGGPTARACGRAFRGFALTRRDGGCTRR